jgi:hypothetical protein
MEYPPFGSEPVLRPYLFDMDQPPLALAEHKVLESGELQQVVFGKH